jgi:Gpi18-like mannosyltransferase
MITPSAQHHHILRLRLLDIGFILGALLLLKLAYVATAIYVVQHYEVEHGTCLKEKAIDRTCLSHLIHRFDSGWYVIIAENGHHRIQPEQLYLADDGKTIQQSYYNFFPLYPMSVRALMAISGVSDARLMMLYFSLVISALNALLFFRFALSYFGSRPKAYWALAFFFLLPFQYYHHVALTEPLFILGLILAFSGIRMREWWALALGVAIVTLTRPNGIFTGLPLVLFYLQETQSWQQIGNWMRGRERFAFNQVWPQHWPLLIFMVFPVCFFGYFCYLLYMTGDFFAFYTANTIGWNAPLTYPWVSFFNKSNFFEQFLSCYTCAFIALTLAYARQMRSAFTVLIAITILLAISRGSLLSIQRYICILFPFAFMFVDILYRLPEYTLKVLLLAGLLAFHFWTYSLHVRTDWLAC